VRVCTNAIDDPEVHRDGRGALLRWEIMPVEWRKKF
jgi:hypothetical protein